MDFFTQVRLLAVMHEEIITVMLVGLSTFLTTYSAGDLFFTYREKENLLGNYRIPLVVAFLCISALILTYSSLHLTTL